MYKNTEELELEMRRAYDVVREEELDRELIQIRYSPLIKCFMIVFMPNAKHGTNVLFSKDLAARHAEGQKAAAHDCRNHQRLRVLQCVQTGHDERRQGAAVAHSPQGDQHKTTRKQRRTHRLQSRTVHATAEKELQYNRHLTVDQLWGPVTVVRRQGVCGVGVSSDNTSLSFTIKDARLLTLNSRTPFVVVKRKTWDDGKIANATHYYLDQIGGMPVFVGRRHQHGHGLAQTVQTFFAVFDP